MSRFGISFILSKKLLYEVFNALNTSASI